MRWARLDDAEHIAAYHHLCWSEGFTGELSEHVFTTTQPDVGLWNDWLSEGSEFTTVVVPDRSDTPIAHTTVRPNQLVHLFVHPEHQGLGLGRRLLGVGEDVLRSDGCVEVELHTRVGNDRAIALYRSAGWSMTDEFVDDTGLNGTVSREHVMRKTLLPPQ